MTIEKTPNVLPEGYWNIITLDAKWEETLKSKEAGSNNAWALKVKCAVASLDHFNHIIYAGFNFVNPSTAAADIAKEKWKNFLLAMNAPFFSFHPSVGLNEIDLYHILYKQLRVKTSHWTDPKGIVRPNINGFYPMLISSPAPVVTPSHTTSQFTENPPPLPSSQNSTNIPSYFTEDAPFDGDIPL